MNPQAAEVFIPISMFIVAGLVIVAMIRAGVRKRELLSQEIMTAIEKGAEVPYPEIPKKRYLLPGLIWTLIGLVMTAGMSLAIPPDAPTGMWVWGLLPVAVGVAFLIVHFIEQKEDKEDISS